MSLNMGSKASLYSETTAPKEESQRWPLVGLSLGSFLQVIAMEQQTCILEVYHSANQWGHFCFIEGSLYDASCGDLDAEDAAIEMMSWQKVRFNIKQIINASDISKKIKKNLMSLLMESSKRQDESEDILSGDYEAVEPEKMKLDILLGNLKKEMGDALIAANIKTIGTERISTAYNVQREIIELFDSLSFYLKDVLTNSPCFGNLDRHYVIDMANQQTLVVLFNDCEWRVMFNNTKCTLGLFMNVIIPKVTNSKN